MLARTLAWNSKRTLLHLQKCDLSIGVIGAGQMGVGIAHVAALAKHDVVLLDSSRQKTDKALEFIGKEIEQLVGVEQTIMESRLF
jgi:3-hydroxybutyryl-CoA dehydrogenase